MEEHNRNRFTFGLGTVGRDMLYSMVSMYFIVYLTEVLDLPDATMLMMTAALTVLRIFDAVNDPFMGVLVDNTRTRHGKFKPWIAGGGIVGGIFTILLFTDFGLTGPAYVAAFVVIYLLWDLTYGLNDIAYWSMLPALTVDQGAREKMGAFARICANVGMYAVVVGILPVTKMLGEALGDPKKGWFAFAVIVVVLMLFFLCFTLFGVKEDRSLYAKEEHTSLKDMFTALFKNDQLLWTAVAMALFNVGYFITTGFGVHYFKYAYGDEGMYSIFAAVLGVAQLTALILFPLFSKRFDRKKLYTGATILVAVGYVVFFFAPMNMLPIGVAGMCLFIGQAFIQLLMLMFLADTIEYGQWKLGKRNESVTFSVQPFLNKLGGAVSNGVMGVTLVVSGINAASSPADVSAGGIWMLKVAMMILPLVCIVAGYLVYRAKFKIDKGFFERIVGDLCQRGEMIEK